MRKLWLRFRRLGTATIEKFEDSDENYDKLCDYYVEGFNIFGKYFAKHHLELDFAKLDVEEVEKEILADHPSKAIAENKCVMEEAAKAPVDPSSSNFS